MSILSVIKIGSPVLVSGSAAQKQPNYANAIARVTELPTHPCTWIRVKFPDLDNETATFRSSSLIPLTENLTPIAGWLKQAQLAQQEQQAQQQGGGLRPSPKKQIVESWGELMTGPRRARATSITSSSSSSSSSQSHVSKRRIVRAKPKAATAGAGAGAGAGATSASSSAARRMVAMQQCYVNEKFPSCQPQANKKRMHNAMHLVVSEDFPDELTDLPPDGNFRMLTEAAYACAHVPAAALTMHGLGTLRKDRQQQSEEEEAMAQTGTNGANKAEPPCQSCGNLCRIPTDITTANGSIPICWNANCNASPFCVMPDLKARRLEPRSTPPAYSVSAVVEGGSLLAAAVPVPAVTHAMGAMAVAAAMATATATATATAPTMMTHRVISPVSTAQDVVIEAVGPVRAVPQAHFRSLAPELLLISPEAAPRSADPPLATPVAILQGRGTATTSTTGSDGDFSFGAVNAATVAGASTYNASYTLPISMFNDAKKQHHPQVSPVTVGADHDHTSAGDLRSPVIVEAVASSQGKSSAVHVLSPSDVTKYSVARGQAQDNAAASAVAASQQISVSHGPPQQ